MMESDQIINADSTDNFDQEKAKIYTRKKLLFQLLTSFLSLMVLGGIIASQAHLDALQQINLWTDNYYHQFLLLTAWIGLIAAFFTIPFKIYGDYLLEQVYELSNQSFGQWIKDQIKGLFVLLVLAIPLLYMFAYLYRNYELWWLIFAIIMFFYTLFIAMIVPHIILPFFYKLKTIDDEELAGRLKKIADKVGLELSGVFSFNLSRETKKANAAMVGLGKKKRVILSDTLLNSFTDSEIETVFAHECGHFKEKHILKNIVFSLLIFVMGLWIINFMMEKIFASNYYELAYVPVLFLMFKVYAMVTHPMHNSLSRKFEYQADKHAVILSGKKDDFISALEKLARINLADISPGKWMEVLFYSHPSIENRIKYVRQMEGL